MFNLYQVITTPTRITVSSSTLLDHMPTNDIALRMIAGTLPICTTDHLPIFALFYPSPVKDTPTVIADLPAKTHSLTEVLDNKLYKKELLNNALEKIDWSQLYGENDVNIALNIFTEKINRTTQCFLKKIRRPAETNKPKKPWITRELLGEIKLVRNLYLSFLNRRSDDTRTIWKWQSKKLKKSINRAEKTYFINKVYECRGNSTKLWKIYNSLRGKQQSTVTLPAAIKHDGKEITSREEVACALNSYFATIGTKLANEIPYGGTRTFTDKQEIYKLEKLVIQDSDTIQAIQLLKPSNTLDTMGIHTQILKDGCHSLSAPLTHIIRLSLEQGIFPAALKMAKIIPIYKSGCQTMISNYRPLSILPTLAKIFEKIVERQLRLFLERNKLIQNCQYGFRSLSSTIMAISNIHERIIENLTKKLTAIGIFLDLRKAFDTVDHSILLEKLSNLGISGNLLNWFADYLKNRSQYIRVENWTSPSEIITAGVPQGSILGPLLFIIYVNDLSNSLQQLMPLLFADDSNLFGFNKDRNELQELVNGDLCRVAEWLKMNRLSINLEKTHFMVFQTRKMKSVRKNDLPLEIQIDGKSLNEVQTIRFLGITLQSSCLE
eukprot:Pompholyxophrys_punicea_v1_NODE_31_length_5106_cov_5.948276.p1 type:complete len:607 gc:universal NODE_31_length_5106_cov_5.948276:3591-1771(-)